LNSAGGSFCSSCGARLVPGDREAGVAAAPRAASGGFRLDDPLFWSGVQERAKRHVLPLAVVALVAFMDYQLHAEAVVALVVAGVGAAIVLFFQEAISWLGEKLNLAEAGRWASMLMVSVPVAFYFFVRGKGTLEDGDALLVSAAIAGLPLAFNWLAPRVDPTLRGFYEARDRMIPVVARPLVLAGLSLVLTFGLIHGNLGDIKILFGGTASKAAFPDPDRILMTAVLNIVLGFALLHTPTREAGA
jgi:hypothetical protein